MKGGEIRAFVDFFPDVRAKRDNPDPDAFIARVAERQYGVVSLAQLHSAGLTSSSIDRRVATPASTAFIVLFMPSDTDV